MSANFRWRGGLQIIREWWATKTRFAPKVLRAKLLARTHPTLIDGVVGNKNTLQTIQIIMEWWATKTRFAPKVLRAKLLARTHPFHAKVSRSETLA